MRYDYKSAPLLKLEAHLKQAYEKVYVITDEEGTFPNGDMDFFIRNGYTDDGLVSSENRYCKLHLMSKNL